MDRNGHAEVGLILLHELQVSLSSFARQKTPQWFVHFMPQGACWNSPMRPHREAVMATEGRGGAGQLGAYWRERDLVPEQVDRWRQAALDANAQPLRMAEQKGLEKRKKQDQREIRRLQMELRRKGKGLAAAAALL